MKKYIVVFAYNQTLDAGSNHPSGICMCGTMNEQVSITSVSGLFDRHGDAEEARKRWFKREWDAILEQSNIADGWELWDDGNGDCMCCKVKRRPSENGGEEIDEILDSVWLFKFAVISVDVQGVCTCSSQY